MLDNHVIIRVKIPTENCKEGFYITRMQSAVSLGTNKNPSIFFYNEWLRDRLWDTFYEEFQVGLELEFIGLEIKTTHSVHILKNK